MDRGILTDTNGREANFRNVILVMTTNAGADQAARRTIGFTTQDHRTDAMEVIRKGFSPEFRNRLDAIVQFQALGFEHFMRLVRPEERVGGKGWVSMCRTRGSPRR